eukprot:Pgem_evm1s16415
MTEQPNENSEFTLKLLVKVMQNLANLKEFSDLKESNMTALNPFIQQNKEKMKQYISEIS